MKSFVGPVKTIYYFTTTLQLPYSVIHFSYLPGVDPFQQEKRPKRPTLASPIVQSCSWHSLASMGKCFIRQTGERQGNWNAGQKYGPGDRRQTIAPFRQMNRTQTESQSLKGKPRIPSIVRVYVIGIVIPVMLYALCLQPDFCALPLPCVLPQSVLVRASGVVKCNTCGHLERIELYPSLLEQWRLYGCYYDYHGSQDKKLV